MYSSISGYILVLIEGGERGHGPPTTTTKTTTTTTTTTTTIGNV